MVWDDKSSYTPPPTQQQNASHRRHWPTRRLGIQTYTEFILIMDSDDTCLVRDRRLNHTILCDFLENHAFTT
eukprot:1357790-Amorphochlora_amoeboformis.AAC.1